MSDRSAIEWTDATWNPIRARRYSQLAPTMKVGWYCEHASPGCANCYAESMNRRLGTGLPFKPGHREDVYIFLDEEMLLAPLRWKKPRDIFVCSMTDLFANFVIDEWIDRIFAIMALCPQHRFQVLTKRAKRMRDYASDWATARMIEWPLANVWLGTSAEDQTRADERIPDLLAMPAAVRFVSLEPLLGPIDVSRWMPRKHYYNAICEKCGHIGSTEYFHEARNQDDADVVCPKCNEIILANEIGKLDWIIVGGESGPHARPMRPDWARDIRDQCAAAGVPFFFKQWDGAKRKRAWGRLLDGVEHNAMPRSADAEDLLKRPPTLSCEEKSGRDARAPVRS